MRMLLDLMDCLVSFHQSSNTIKIVIMISLLGLVSIKEYNQNGIIVTLAQYMQIHLLGFS